jgi:hypothetical protein
MAGVFNGDVIIKQCIEQGLQDIRNNPWLIDHIMGQFNDEPSLRKAYGQQEIQNCKDWFLNNTVKVLLKYRLDKEETPCITIALGSSSEKEDMKHMSDQSTTTVTLMPAEINKPINYIIKPFTPTSFDEATGEIGVPNTVNIRIINPGMVVVDPKTGNGYVVIGKNTDSILI